MYGLTTILSYSISILILIVFMYFMFYIWNMKHIKFTKFVFNIALAVFIGAPVGGFLMFHFLNILGDLCILQCSAGLGAIIYYLIGIPFGVALGVIVVLVICFRHDKHTQIPSSFYEYTQNRKRKNDDKPKNLPLFPRSDKRINDNRS